MEKVFADDELTLVTVQASWSKEEILSRDGLFLLKEIVGPLNLKTSLVVARIKKLPDPYATAGLKKFLNYWMVRMKVFRVFYEQNLVPKTRLIDPTWTTNDLMMQKGHFFLSDVCVMLPFSGFQIRYQVRKAVDPRGVYGCWKDEQLQRFVVDMEVFSVWMRRLHVDGDFS